MVIRRLSIFFKQKKVPFVTLCLLLGAFSLSCKKELTRIVNITTDSIVAQSSSYLLYGTIIDKGNEIEEYGCCWASHDEPTISDQLTSANKTILGTFSLPISNLNNSINYYFRAYAIEKGHITYGNIISLFSAETQIKIKKIFQYDLDSIGIKTIISRANNDEISSYGYCWSETNLLPNIDGEHASFAYESDTVINSSVINNLQPDKKYYVRAYLVSNEEVIYSETMSFVAGKLLFQNSFDTKNEIAIGYNNIPITQISYKINNWDQAQLIPFHLGNGLFINQGDDEGWHNDGANFFAISASDMQLSLKQGSIEFSFTFLFDSDSNNYAYFFDMACLLTDHFSNNIEQKESIINAGWDGWATFEEYKYFFFEINNTRQNNPVMLKVTPEEAAIASFLNFKTNTTIQFGFYWDIEGIHNSNETMQMYINNIKAGFTTEKWDTTSVLDDYLYLGARPTSKIRDSYCNGVNGIYDNLKIYNFAKAGF